MKKIFSLLSALIIFLTYNINPQDQELSKISGKVFDSKTKLPVHDVNIYLSSTLYGTTTNSKGDYILSKIPDGEYKLVVSRIGYEPIVIDIIVKDSKHLEKTFYLDEKIYDFDEVTVEAKRPDKWKEQLDIFKKYFFGLTEYSANCKIENEYDLDFKESESDELIATAKRPLIIINKSLGYSIYCELKNFQYNPASQTIQTVYYPYFQLLNPADVDEYRIWKKNRKFARLLSLNRVLISLAKSNFELNEYMFEKCEGYSTDCRQIKPDQIPITFNPETGFNTISFPYNLRIKNHLTGSDSYISLPFGYAQFNRYGFVRRAYSVKVFGDFAKLGISTVLPQEYYDEKMIEDLLEKI